MDNVYAITNGELCHWGVKGMRWGVRRYVNKDGTLTTAGKKRYNKEMDKVKKEQQIVKNKAATKAKLDRLETMKKNVAAQKKELDDGSTNIKKRLKGKSDDQTPKRRKISELSDEELRSKVNRLQLEQQYKNLRPTDESANKGKGFFSKFKDEAIKPAAINAGRDLMQNWLKKKGADLLGLNEKEADDGMAALKKEWDTWRMKAGIKSFKDQLNTDKSTTKTSESTNNESQSKNATTSDKDSTRTQREQNTNPYTDVGKSRVQYLLGDTSSYSKPTDSYVKKGEKVTYDIFDRDGNYITTKRYRQ